jgi:hypothetical protein
MCIGSILGEGPGHNEYIKCVEGFIQKRNWGGSIFIASLMYNFPKKMGGAKFKGGLAEGAYHPAPLCTCMNRAKYNNILIY